MELDYINSNTGYYLENPLLQFLTNSKTFGDPFLLKFQIKQILVLTLIVRKPAAKRR